MRQKGSNSLHVRTNSSQQTVLEDNWTAPNWTDPNYTMDNTIHKTGYDNDIPHHTVKPDNNGHQLKKKVSFRLLEMRRKSLTGSLPDLAKAPTEDIMQCVDISEFETNIKRAPLPCGSEVFKTVMGEMDSESSSSSESIPDSLSKSWNGPGTNQKRLPHKTHFHSKAAAVIYAKLFIAPFPRDLDQSKSFSNPSSPRLLHGQKPKINTFMSSLSYDGTQSLSPPLYPHIATRLSHSTPTGGSSPSSPRIATKNIGKSSPLLSSSPPINKLSPLVSPEDGMSLEMLGKRSQFSLPPSSPRLLHRKKQNSHKLVKSNSLEHS